MKKFDFEKLKSYVNPGLITMEKHPDADLYIFGITTLGRKRIIWDDLNVNCRGLIINSEGEVMARAFTKFFTFRGYLSENKLLLAEGQVLDIPEGAYTITEKMDGSLSILYWIGDTPYIASQRSFTSTKALRSNEIFQKKYKHTIDKLDKSKTYLFEAIYPECRVAVDYGDREELCLIGILDNETGDELPLEDVGFPLVKDHTEDFRQIADLKSMENLNLSNIEGLVITYENGIKVKVKFPWYEYLHKPVGRTVDAEKNLYENYREVKRLYNLPHNRLSNLNVWETILKWKTLETILARVTAFHYTMGVEEWLEDEHRKLINAYKKVQSEDLKHEEVCALIKPDEDDLNYFDTYERMTDPVNENIMHNRIIRLANRFD